MGLCTASHVPLYERIKKKKKKKERRSCRATGPGKETQEDWTHGDVLRKRIVRPACANLREIYFHLNKKTKKKLPAAQLKAMKT